MKKWLLAALCAMVLASAWMIACGDDDDDDSGGSIDCTESTLCAWAVDSCGEYASAEDCAAEAATCDEGVVDCLCGCMNADPACDNDSTGDCAYTCKLQHCG
jgi:hypothetical protein